MPEPIVMDLVPLGFPWVTRDPFLFCVHHNDAYPVGNAHMGPAASLSGRRLGMDFSGKDGWSMYHGDVVPGFPRHPHRGFETVTLARRGFIDHSDSLGATARFGKGDVQWMTAGRGIVHAEMFPLVREDAPNPVELFQIWLNLPAASKLVDPYFTMLWADGLGRHTVRDAAGLKTEVTVVAGALGEMNGAEPPPDSWAAREEASVAIWTIEMEAGASWRLPAAPRGVNRMLYAFVGSGIAVAQREVSAGMAVELRSDAEVALENGSARSELLLLQGRPIGEPVAQHGPFVMNTTEELVQAYEDYRRTGFGGWPWRSDAPVHPRDRGRFAVHVDGRVEEAT